MRPVTPLSRWMMLAAVVSIAAPAAAHEYWIAPSAYRAGAGDTIDVRAYVGTGFRGEPKPYAATRTVRLDLQTGTVRDLRAAATNGAEELARFVLPDDGGAAVSYEGRFAFIELPAPEFDAYLVLEGLEGPRRARQQAAGDAAARPVRERYARCCRTWIAGRDASARLAPVGLTIELVPLADPTAGRDVSFEVRLRGRPLAGALVRAWRRPLEHAVSPFAASARDSVGPVFERRTNREGRVRMPATGDGEWLVSCVHMEPSEAPAEADWQSWWASFTFARTRARR